MTTTDDLRAWQPVVNAFESLGVEYHIGGSVASMHHGMMRTTIDIDLVARLDESHVDRFVAMLGDAYYAEPTMIRDAIRRQSSFNLIHLDTMYKIDVFAMLDTPFDQSVRRRVVDGEFATSRGRVFPFTSAEDIILHKLLWYRAGEGVSERQWLDVIGVLQIKHDQLDDDYLTHWANELGILDLLDRARRESTID